MRITLLFEPSADRAIPFAAGPERYQRLADELSRYAGIQVQIITDVLRNAPTDSYLLFAGSRDLSRSLSDCAPALATRIVLLDVSWQKALEQLEKHRLAGAVDSLRLSEWLARPSSCTGPFGRRYLSKPLGASCVPMPAFCSPHYCLLQSTHHRGMPHLLADYLIAYDRDQRPLGTVPSVSLVRALREITEGAGGQFQTKGGHPAMTFPTSQVESVSIKRAIDSLKRARESAQMTLLQVAGSSGIDPDQLEVLEGSGYHRATLGTLRAYFLALEHTWGWTLAETRESSFPGLPKTSESVDLGRTNFQPNMASRIGPETLLVGPSKVAERFVSMPRVRVEKGMTIMDNNRSRHRQPEREIDKPTVRTRREESYAGV